MAGRAERRRARDQGGGADAATGSRGSAGGASADPAAAPFDWLNPPAPPPPLPSAQGRWRPADEPDVQHCAPDSFETGRSATEPGRPTQATAMPAPESRRGSRRAQREQEREQEQERARERAQSDQVSSSAPPAGGFTSPGQAQPAEQVQPPKRRRRTLSLWLLLVALGLLAWAATCFIDSGSDLIAGPAALAPLITVVALPVLAIGIGSKHLVSTAIAVVAVLIPWALVAGYAVSGPGLTTVGGDNTLRVMEVDGSGGAASAHDIVQLSRSYDVDVVVVTQLSNGLAHQLTVQGLGSVLAARWVNVPPGSGRGTGLWSRLTVTDLQPMDGLSAPSVQGLISTGTTNVQITVAHLAGEPLLPGHGWRSDLTELAAEPTTGPQFIVGGLDATPWQPAFRKLTRAGWHDSAAIVGQGLRPTWPAWSPLPVAPLDHVLVRGGLGVSETTTQQISGADHRALIATLILPHQDD